jgi:hypothetical protein
MRWLLACGFGALVLGATGCGGDESAPVLPLGRAIETSRTLTPTTHLFADEPQARLEIVVDRRLLDPDRIRVATQFEPYEVVGGVERSRRELGEYTRLHYDYTLRCLTADCIPVRIESMLGEQEEGRGERRTFRFPPAVVRYAEPGRKEPELLLSVSWPPLTSVSRLNEAQANAEFPFRLSPTPLPALSYRVNPLILAAIFVAVGLLLVGLPARATVRWWRRRRPAPEPVPEIELSPLERARALVVWSCEHGDSADRRRALSNLAVELARSDGNGLVEDALGLAWSRPAPRPEEALALAHPTQERA